MLTRHDVLRFSCLVFRILCRFLAALAGLAVRSGRSKDLEIIVLRHQLTVLRRQDNRPQLNHNDRTLLGAIAAEVRRLVIDMATDNPTWRQRRIHGELTGLGHQAGASTVWRILKSHGIHPAPQRANVSWNQFPRSQAAVACDLATIDTALLRRYYLLFFIDAFDEIFRTEGLKILKTPAHTAIGGPPAGRVNTHAVGALTSRIRDIGRVDVQPLRPANGTAGLLARIPDSVVGLAVGTVSQAEDVELDTLIGDGEEIDLVGGIGLQPIDGSSAGSGGDLGLEPIVDWPVAGLEHEHAVVVWIDAVGRIPIQRDGRAGLAGDLEVLCRDIWNRGLQGRGFGNIDTQIPRTPAQPIRVARLDPVAVETCWLRRTAVFSGVSQPTIRAPNTTTANSAGGGTGTACWRGTFVWGALNE